MQQECLIATVQAIWDYADCFDEENEFENWIGSVARYCCLGFLRSHRKEATIAWLIEKEITEEQEMMISCLEPSEQELFALFLSGENAPGNIAVKYHNMYELLNRIDTDIFEYEKEPLAREEQEEMVCKVQTRKRQRRRGFSLRKYLARSLRKTIAVSC